MNHSGRGRAQQAAERIHNLKLQRWRMMRDSFEWTDENIRRIEQMNERMKEALLDMRRRTIEVYESLNSWCTSDKELHVKVASGLVGHPFLSYKNRDRIL